MGTIKRMSVLLAVLALIPLAWGQIATNEPPLSLAIDLMDGSRIIGVPSIASIPVQTAYAKLDIALKHVRSITMEQDREMAVTRTVLAMAPHNTPATKGGDVNELVKHLVADPAYQLK